ncbi:uroporphyrinogen-III synthase [Sphingomonas sp.]|uniref:uroporphyrinogen-III synthase n=1 Tax=Sphingomonas sp. TaxID=28214 RepID=UPI00286CE78F|nr:uroporphyrinogen-III synthase [Sphingomonas sp.]
MKQLAVLRPEPGARATVERARAMGLDAFAMPLFKVEAVAWDVPDPNEFDALLLTSANAVRHGGAGLRRVLHLPVHAVGEATADAAREAGFTIASVGHGGVAQLLGSVPSDARLLHLCGEHRVDISAPQAIRAVPVYRSLALPPPGDLRKLEGQVVAVHSPRAGRRLAELVDQARIERATIRLAAISEAAAAAAGGGWAMRDAAATPDDLALLALAARLCDRGVTT